MPTTLVTGASQGVGPGVAEELAEAGFTVFVTGRDRPRLEETGRRGAALGGLVMARVVDHRDDGQVEWLFAEIAAAAVARELAVVDADGHSPRPLGPDEA